MFDYLVVVSYPMTKGHWSLEKGVTHCISHTHTSSSGCESVLICMQRLNFLCLSCTKWHAQVLKTFTVKEGHQVTWILSNSAVFRSGHGCYEAGCIKLSPSFFFFSFSFGITHLRLDFTDKKDYHNHSSFRNGSDACLSIKQTLNIWNGAA